ncbi:unnamed protein product [Amaranthus hypochondriacus]
MTNKIACFLGYLAILSLLSAMPILCDQSLETAPSCTIIIADAAACLPYITQDSPSPSGPCCDGIKSMAGMANTHENAISICNCLKSNLAGFQYNPSLIAALPKKCSVNINLPPISKDIDCSKVSIGLMATRQN